MRILGDTLDLNYKKLKMTHVAVGCEEVKFKQVMVRQYQHVPGTHRKSWQKWSTR